MVIFLDKTAIFVNKMAIFIEKITIFLDRTGILLEKMTIFLDKTAIFLEKMAFRKAHLRFGWPKQWCFRPGVPAEAQGLLASLV